MPTDSSSVEIIGRRSSHFTRVTLIFAHELGVSVELIPVYDLMTSDPTGYAGNPALKLPTLRRGGSLVFGTENICRALFELSGSSRRIIFPDQLRSDLSRNAQEMVWHAMSAQVQLVLGLIADKLPPESRFFAKIRTGLEGALSWLDGHLSAALQALPAERELSLFEVSLFCLWEHLIFRETVSLAPHSNLRAFAEEFAKRPSAELTRYFFDKRPAVGT